MHYPTKRIERIDFNGNFGRYLLGVAILLGALAVLIGLTMSASAATLPAWIGTDMNVVGDEYYSDSTSELGANISVQSGGNLTLDNVSITVNAGFSIDVFNGGRLFINNTNISYNLSTGTGFGVVQHFNGTLIVLNSTIDGYDNFDLYDVLALIDGNTLTPSSSGLDGIDMWYSTVTFSKDGPTITNNDIGASSEGLYIDGSSTVLLNATFDNNTFVSNLWDAIYGWLSYASFDSLSFSGNTITSVTSGDSIYFDLDYSIIGDLLLDNNTVSYASGDGVYLNAYNINATGGTIGISGNDFDGVNGDGVYLDGAYGDYDHVEIDNNVIRNSNIYYAIYIQAEHATYSMNSIDVSGNDIQNTEYGIYFYDRYTTWGNINVDNNNLNNIYYEFVYFYPYSTIYGGDVSISNNSFSNSGGFYDTVRWYFSSSSSYAPTYDGDIRFNDNDFNSVRTAWYMYQQYTDFNNVTINDNTFSSISGYGVYFSASSGTMEDLIMNNNTFNTISSYASYIVPSYGMNDVAVTNNTFSSINSYGFYLSINSYQSYGNITFTDNDMNSMGSSAVYIYGYRTTAGDMVIKNNTLNSVSGDGFYLYFYYGNSIESLTFEDNTLSSVSGYQVYMYWYRIGNVGNMSIQWNTITNPGYYSFYLYGYFGNFKDIIFRNNTLNSVDYYGFRCYCYYGSFSNVIFEDNYISSSGNGYYGIYFYGSYSGTLKNVSIQRNIVQNMNSYGIYLNIYRKTATNVRICNNTVVQNNYGIYYSHSYGSAVLSLIQNNTVVSNNNYGMYLGLYGSTMVPIITNNQIVNNGDGIYLSGYNGNLDGGLLSNNTLIKNQDGLSLDSVKGVKIENNKINSNSQTGLTYYGDWQTPITSSIYNNEISNNNVDIQLYDGVILKSYNNTFETSGATIWNLKPELWVMGILDVQVLWEDGSGPVGDAVLTVTDTQDNLLLDDRTDSGGWYTGIEVIIYTVDPDGTTFNSPFTVNASKFGILSTNLIEAESYTLAQIFLDNVPPAVDVYTPIDGLVTNVLSLKVAGQTEAGALLKINGEPVNLTQAGTFEYFVSLDQEGNNDIRIEAQDMFNNTATILLHVTRDTVPPPLTIYTPKDGEATNTPSFLVEGETEPGAFVKVNEQPVPVDDIGRFSAKVLLAEGENTVTVIVTDVAGNEVTRSLKVFLDSVPPDISILTPDSGLITNLKEIEIRGIASGADTVKVNGITLKLLGESFASSYKLILGTNTLLFEAWDDVGNYASYELVIIEDNNPPALEVISPKDNMFTGNDVLVVSGSSEISNIVTVSGVQVTLDPNNGLFTYTLLLKEGTNRIVVRSLDPIGNTIEIVRNVFLDTMPPILTVTSPGDSMVTSNPKVIVEGIVEVNSELTINGEAVPIEQGTFKKTLTLGEGDNRIVVVATDKAQNKVTVIKEVYLDTEAGLQIFAPADGLRTTQENITFTGRVETGSFLKINGLDIDLDNQSRFARQFSLELGTNDFELVVTDTNGNIMTVYRSVIREDVYVPPEKNNVEAAADNNWIYGLLAALALIIAVVALLMLFMQNKRYRERDTPYGGIAAMEVEPEDEDMQEDLDDELPPPPPAGTKRAPPPPEPEESPFKPMDEAEAKGISDSAAEGEIIAQDTDLTELKNKVQKLEDTGADTTKARQSLRMAQIYIDKNRKEKAEKHIAKAKQILSELDTSSEIEATGGEVEMKDSIKKSPTSPPPAGSSGGIPKIPPPPFSGSDSDGQVRKVKRLKKVRKGGDE